MTAASSSSMRWLIAAIVCCARTGVGVQFIAVAALSPDIKPELGLDDLKIGILLGVFMIAGLFLSLPGGMIASYVGDQRMLSVGLLGLIMSGLIAGLCDSFAFMLFGRIIGGFGAVFVTVTGAKMLSDWFDGKKIATAMSLIGVTWPLGIALGMSVLPSLSEWLGWRIALLAACIVPALALLLTVLLPLVPESSREEGTAATRPSLWSIRPREFWPLLAGSVAWPLMSSGGYVVFSAYAPGHLALAGVAHDDATLIVSLLSWAIIVTIPLGGYLADRMANSDVLFWCGCLISGLAISMVPITGPWALWVLLAAVLGLTVGPVMALPNEILSPEYRGTGLGLFYTVYYLGTVCFPALAGWLLQISGSPAIVIWFSALCLLLAPLFLMLSRQIYKRPNQYEKHNRRAVSVTE